MSRSKRALLVCAALIALCAGSAYADSLTIDLPTAHARARQYAPDAITALARDRRSARCRDRCARSLQTESELVAGAGVRSGPPSSTAVETRLEHGLEIGQRSRRIAVADAGVREARAASEADLRALDLAVTLAFNEARHADLAIEIRRCPTLTSRAVAAAERRHKSGDLTDLELDLAHSALGRARASVAAARAGRADAIGKLAVLIGARPDDVITLQGDLAPAPFSLDSLRATVASRPDVKALEAEAGVARARPTSPASSAGRPSASGSRTTSTSTTTSCSEA